MNATKETQSNSVLESSRMLQSEKFRDFLHSHEPIKYRKKEFIYLHGDRPDSIYVVLDGRVRICALTNDQMAYTKAIVEPGDVFGELAVIDSGRRTDLAQAMDQSTCVCRIPVEAMQRLLIEDKTLNHAFLHLLGVRMRKMETKIDSMIVKNSRTRIVDFLRETALEKGQKVGFETMIKNHLLHKDIASLTGTARQTVNRVLNELREKNMINFDRRRILIRDLDQLR